MELYYIIELNSDWAIQSKQREPTWDEWQEYVKESNQKVLTLIKEKDYDYYYENFVKEENE